MSVHRIRIRAEVGGDPVAVDLALPSGTPVGDLMPAIVAMVVTPPTPGTTGRGWRLDRLTGDSLSESLSLGDNVIHDGELLILVPEHAPPLGVMRVDPCRDVAEARPGPAFEGVSSSGTVCVVAAVLAAVALIWTGVAGQTVTNMIVAAIGAAVAVTATRTSRHPTAPGMAAVVLTAATGFLAVPSGPAVPNVLLAAAAALAAALLVQRVSGYPSPVWSGTAALCFLVTVATVLPMPVVMAGAGLSTAAVGLLTVAPRIAVLTAGLGPDHWTDDMGDRSATGHAVLTGVVAGCAAGAAAGAVVVAIEGVRVRNSPMGAIVFTALIGLVLLLRIRSYVEPSRQISLGVAGFASITCSLGSAVATFPWSAGGVAGALIAIALLVSRRLRTGSAASRWADRTEYAALAAVIPMALWVGGFYTLVGSVRLP